jgi:hypothetical protein
LERQYFMGHEDFMGHEAIFKALSDIAAADSMTYFIVGGLTALVFLIMRAMLPVKSLATVFAPGLFWGGLVGIYTLRQLAFVISSERSAHIMAASAVGMIVALLVMVVLVRLVQSVNRIRNPLTNDPGRAGPRVRAVVSP